MIEIGHMMREVFTVIKLRCNKKIEPSLTHEQTALLFILFHHKEDLTQTDIADFTGKDKSTILRITDVLEEKDLVRRVMDKSDRRKYHLMITKKGQSIFEKHMEIMDEVISELEYGVSEKDLQTFAKVIDHFNSKIKTLKTE